PPESPGAPRHVNRLSLETLAALPATVAGPAYDPRRIGIGIVHLGIGAFHRAQTAVYSDDALAVESAAWGTCGVSLRSADVRDRLSPQDGLYTAVEKSPSGIRRRVIGSVREVLPHNGSLVRGLVLAFAQARNAALARWIEEQASFPSTMVDRTVPATTEADIAENDAALGLHDAAPVMHEPFKQWAIEDNFVA